MVEHIEIGGIKLLTVKEAAEKLGIQPQSVADAIRSGTLRARRITREESLALFGHREGRWSFRYAIDPSDLPKRTIKPRGSRRKHPLATNGVKRCSKCGNSLAISMFCRSSRHPDGISDRCKACSAEKYREFASKNKEATAARIRRWKDNNPGRVTEYHRRRDARKNGNPVDLDGVAKFYQHAREAEHISCYICGRDVPVADRQVDHVIPLDDGGPHAVWNLACACSSCNKSKGAKTPEAIGITRPAPTPHRPPTTTRYIWFHAVYAPEGTNLLSAAACGTKHGVLPEALSQVADGRRVHHLGWSLVQPYPWAELLPLAAAPSTKLSRSDLVPLTRGPIAFVPLGLSMYAIVDAEDWPRVAAMKWNAFRHQNTNGSRVTWKAASQSFANRKFSLVCLHRFIFGPSGCGRVAPVNGNFLDCRKSNLGDRYIIYANRKAICRP